MQNIVTFSKNSECGYHLEVVYLLNFYIFFQLKNFNTEVTTKEIRKTKEKIMKHVKESTIINEIANEDIENTAKASKVQMRQWTSLKKWRNLLEVTNVVFSDLPTNKVIYLKDLN